jgi:hypothetical protein
MVAAMSVLRWMRVMASPGSVLPLKMRALGGCGVAA